MIAEMADIEAFADRVRDALGDRVVDVILFGSYATDEHVPGSDIDIAIIVTREEDGDESAVWDIAAEFQEQRDLRFSPRIYEKQVFEERIADGFTFYASVAEQGVSV